MYDLGLEETVDGLGESVVVAVADAAHGWFDAGLAQPLGVNGQVLRSAVGVVDEPGPLTAGRSWTACSKASSTKPACAVWLALQPTIRRAWASMTKAT